MTWLLRAVWTGIIVLSAQVYSWAGPAYQQGDIPWDELLDRYESICRQCMDLRNRQEAGQAFSPKQLQDLLNELEQLRGKLKGVSDKMPAPARYRFEAIRRMYASGIPRDTHPPKALVIPASPPALILSTPSAPYHPLRKPLPPSPILLQPIWIVSASSIVMPEPAYGARVSRIYRKWGGYAAFHSNFSHHQTAYDALSDGSSGNTRIWTSGVSGCDRWFLTAGPAYRLGKQWVVSAGLGYGTRKLCWEDSEGAWMRITDASPSGLCAELGTSFLYHHFALSASWISIPLSYSALSLSVGVVF